MHKKIYSMLLAICLCFCMMPTGNAEGGEVKLTVSDAFGVVGNEINVQVSIENSAQVSAGSFNIIYDSSCLELKTCVKGNIFGNISPNINPNYDKGKIRISWFASTTIDEGEIFNITFEALKPGNSQVMLENVKLGTIYADNLTYSTVAGDVTVNDNSLAVLNEIAVISTDNTCFKRHGEEYEYSIENIDFQNKVLYASSYDNLGRLTNVTISEKEHTFSDADINSYMRFFAWDNKMLPLRKAVSINSNGVVCGLIEGKGNIVDASVTNSSSQSEIVTLRVVQYDASGLKIKTVEEKNTIQAGKTDTFSLNFDLEKDSSYVEVFVLNQGMEPMEEVLIFEL